MGEPKKTQKCYLCREEKDSRGMVFEENTHHELVPVCWKCLNDAISAKASIFRLAGRV